MCSDPFRCSEMHSDAAVVSWRQVKTFSDAFRFIQMCSDLKCFKCLNLVAKQDVLRCFQMLSGKNKKNHFSLQCGVRNSRQFQCFSSVVMKSVMFCFSKHDNFLFHDNMTTIYFSVFFFDSLKNMTTHEKLSCFT